MSVETQDHLDIQDAVNPEGDEVLPGIIRGDQDAVRELVFGKLDLSRLHDADPALGGFWSFTPEELRAIENASE